MNINDFLVPEYLIGEVTIRLNDEEFKNGLTRGWYMTQVRDVLDELSFETYFETITADYDLDRNTFAMDFPKGAFNIKEMSVWNGDACTPASSRRVYWKRQFNNTPGGINYTANRVDNAGQLTFDPFYPNDLMPLLITATDVLWANIQGGQIMFSSACGAYAKVRLVYTGIMGSIGDTPIVPRYFGQVVKDWISVHYYDAMLAREPRIYGALYDRAYARLYDNRVGSWWMAKERVATMDDWERENLKEYFNRGNW